MYLMNIREITTAKNKLVEFVLSFKEYLGRSERVHWCEMYLSGLLLDGERKSIQPMAQRLPGGNEQALQQFVNQSPWDYECIQIKLAKYLVNHLEVKQGVLVLDDTSLPKKGNNSVGVSRQYCGAQGKIANCQSIVTWHYVNKSDRHFPILGELYLPENWIKDKERLKRCGVPETRMSFKRKWQLALGLLDKIKEENLLPYEAIVFDAGYGEIKEFLRELNNRGETFLAQIPESHCFWPIDVKLNNKQLVKGRPRQYPEVKDKTFKALSAKNWQLKLTEQRMKWKTIKLPLISKSVTKAVAIRVKEVITQAYYRPGNEYWLLIEKYGRDQFKYYVSNAPANTSIKKLILWAHERWKIEQGYQQLKEELGLDHFEGRSWRGLHQHLTLCFMAYAFLLLYASRLKKTPKQ